MKKYKTFFCDIDGTIFKYRKFEKYQTSKAEVIESTKEYLIKAQEEGHMIILTTARPEYLRAHTEKELQENEIPYSKLIMEIERGPRYLINDMDPDKPGKRAIGINLIRDQGITKK
jgi:uncharacterized HAD superfamily protein